MINKDKYLKYVGKKIAFYRDKKGWSQDELARKCGYTSENSRSTIQKIERGKSDIPLSKLNVIANVLDVCPLELFECPDNYMDIETNNGIAIQVNNANATYNNNTSEQKTELLDIYDNLDMRGKTELLLSAYEIRDKYKKN